MIVECWTSSFNTLISKIHKVLVCDYSHYAFNAIMADTFLLYSWTLHNTASWLCFLLLGQKWIYNFTVMFFSFDYSSNKIWSFLIFQEEQTLHASIVKIKGKIRWNWSSAKMNIMMPGMIYKETLNKGD